MGRLKRFARRLLTKVFYNGCAWRTCLNRHDRYEHFHRRFGGES